MAISKEVLFVYFTVSKYQGKEALNAFLVSQNRQKQLFARLSGLYQTPWKGIRLKQLSYEAFSEANEKIAREFLNGLFQANASDGCVVVYSSSQAARLQSAFGCLFSQLTEQFKGRQVHVVADPTNLRAGQLNNQLKKAGLSLKTEKGSLKEDLGLQISLFLGDALLQDRLAGIQELVTRQMGSGRFLHIDGDEAYLQQAAPDKLLPLYQKLSVLSAGTVDGWLKKNLSKEQLEKLVILLEDGMEEAGLKALTMADLDHRWPEILASYQKPASIFSKRSSALQRQEAWEQLARIRWEMYHLPCAQDACQQQSDAWKPQRQEEAGKALRLRLWEKLLESAQKEKALEVYLQEAGNVLEILAVRFHPVPSVSLSIPALAFEKQTPDGSSKAFFKWEKDEQEKPLDPVDYQKIRFEDPYFAARMESFLTWLEEHGQVTFLHIPEYLETEIKKGLMSRNWQLPLDFQPVPLAEEPGLLEIDPVPADFRPYFPREVDSLLEEEQLRFLAQPNLSLAFTKRLALAFTKGLDVRKATDVYYRLCGMQQQLALRSLAAGFLYTTRTQNFLHALARHLLSAPAQPEDDRLAVYDFLANPRFSMAKREVLLESLEHKTPLPLLRQLVSARLPYNQIVNITDYVQNHVHIPDVPVDIVTIVGEDLGVDLAEHLVQIGLDPQQAAKEALESVCQLFSDLLYR